MSNGHAQSRTIQRFEGGVLVGTVEALSPAQCEARCDYCGEPGCHWSVHPQAHADVAAWRRELAREDF